MKYLHELLGQRIHEDQRHEFKVRLGNDLTNLLREIAAFANTEGGDIYLGVKDEDAELCGFLYEELDPIVNRVKNEAKQFLRPKVDIEPIFLSYHDGKKERFIIDLRIKRNLELPVFLYRGSSSVYLRSFSQTILADPEEILALFHASSSYSYDDRSSNVAFNIENFGKLSASFEQANGIPLTKHRLESIPFFDDSLNLFVGSLLFEDGFHGDETAIAVTAFQGIDKGVDLIKKVYEGRGDILTMIKEATQAVMSSTFAGLRKEAFGNKEALSYPERALIEAITNAYAHKDYTVSKGIIEVNIYRDRLEVVSPGSLVEAKRIHKEKDLLSIAPKRRNKLISSILTMVRLMESAGSGFSKITACYSDCDDYHKPYVESTLSSFSLVLPDLIYEHGVIDDQNPNLSLVYQRNGSSSKHDDSILRLCYFKERSLLEIAEHLSMKVSTHLRQDILGALVAKGLLIAYGEGNKLLYKTSHQNVDII